MSEVFLQGSEFRVPDFGFRVRTSSGETKPSPMADSSGAASSSSCSIRKGWSAEHVHLFGFWVSVLGFRVSVLGFRVSVVGFRFRLSCFGCHFLYFVCCLGLRVGVQSLRLEVWDLGFGACLGFGDWGLGLGFVDWGLRFRVYQGQYPEIVCR